jgi:hypothetical protein
MLLIVLISFQQLIFAAVSWQLHCQASGLFLACSTMALGCAESSKGK